MIRHDEESGLPKISVITASYNNEKTIANTIESVNSQTYKNLEHIFIDGLSVDKTLHYISELSVAEKIVVSEPDDGIYDALNKGIRLATGDVVGFLHADDVYASNDSLEKIAIAFADSKICGVYGNLDYVSSVNLDKVIRSWKSPKYSSARLRRGWMPPHPTLYVRKSWYERIGGFDTRYRIAADYFSILALFSQPEFRSRHIPDVLVKMRVGGISNRSLRNILLKSREDYNAIRRSGIGGIGTLALKNLSKLKQFI